MGDAASGQTLRRVLLAGSLSVGVAACTGTNDPSQAGFLDGIGNLASGTYDQRIDEREQNLTDAQASSAALQSDLVQSEQDFAALSAEEAQIAGRLDALQRDNQTTFRRLDELRQRRDVSQEQLAQLQSRAEQVQAARDRVAASRIDPAAAAEIAQLEREQAEIDQAIDDILLIAGPVE